MNSDKKEKEKPTTPASAKALAAKLRAIEKANPGMKYRALFLSTIGDVAALKARIDGERKRANERIEAKRQQGYVYGALQYECNDDVVRLALLERLEASTTATEEGSR